MLASNPPQRNSSSSTITLLAAAIMLALPVCSSNDTLLALTINSASDVGHVTKIRVTVSQASKQPVVVEQVPPSDMDSGVINSSFFIRIPLSGWSGTATVQVDALDSTNTPFLTTTTTAMLVENGALAASVMLTHMMPDGGAPDGSAGSGGAGGGAGGAGGGIAPG